MRWCLLTRPFYVNVHSRMGVWSYVSLIGEFQPLDDKKNKKNLVWLIQKIFVGKKKRAQKNGRLPGLFFVAKLSHLTMSWRGASYQKCSKILKIFYFVLFFLTCSQIAPIPLVDWCPVSGYIKTIKKKRKETTMGHIIALSHKITIENSEEKP